MFERYTEGARRVIFFARDEASQYGSPVIETVHILLGLVRAEPEVLRLAIPFATEKAVRSAVDAHVSKSDRKIPTSVDLPISTGCKRVLSYATEEADRTSSHPVTSAHLLLGLLRDEGSLAAGVLRGLGGDMAKARLALAPARKRKSLDNRMGTFYCPTCAREVTDPLTCGDCSAVICRVCGTPLEAPEDLGIG